VEETVRKLIPILILALACNRQESRAQAPVELKSASVASAPEAADMARVAEAPAPAMPRMIVRTADVKIVVADTAKSIEAITRSAEAAGGYVSGSNIWREGELLRAKLTLRVPADKLTATLAAIRGVAKRVENETVASEDVSQEFVDLESRVRNLEATEAELRELLTVARVSSKKAADVLEVHAQLTVVRGEIEQARGRMRYLSQVTSMSAITLEVMPDAIAQPVVEPGWRPLIVARDASRALVALLQSVATGTIWFLIYIVPILGMLSLLIAALVKLARRVRTREA
jgi:hypothetical protein